MALQEMQDPTGEEANHQAQQHGEWSAGCDQLQQRVQRQGRSGHAHDSPPGSAPATTTTMPARMTAPGSSKPMPIRLRRYPRHIAIAAGQTTKPTRQSSGTAAAARTACR